MSGKQVVFSASEKIHCLYQRKIRRGIPIAEHVGILAAYCVPHVIETAAAKPSEKPQAQLGALALLGVGVRVFRVVDIREYFVKFLVIPEIQAAFRRRIERGKPYCSLLPD